MSKFGHIKTQYDPRGRTAIHTLPIRGYVDPKTGIETPATLTMRHAGEGNTSWHNASMKFNAKHGVARKTLSGRSDAEALSLSRDIDLYPKYVITGWDGICDGDGQLVPFSEENCRDFLQSLPKWIFDEVRVFALTAANFLPDEEPTSDEVQETVGN